MRSAYVKEQKRYTINEISMIFNFSNTETIRFIKKLKAYGVLKTVKATSKEKVLSELIDEEIELVDECDNSTNHFYVFTFVGVLVVGNIVIKCYPKYILEQVEPLEQMKQVIEVISKYKSKEQSIHMISSQAEENDFNFLSTIIYLYKDYYENNVYSNEKEIIEDNGEGEYLWDEIINETFPCLNNNRPIYMELKISQTINDDMDYFTRLHKYILSECSHHLKDANLLELFNFEEIYFEEYDILDFGDIEYILYRLENEINVQYITRKRNLLKVLYSYIAHTKASKDSFGISMYGTNNFNLVWEKVCADVIGNVLGNKISELPIIGNNSLDNKKLSELIEKPKWRAFLSTGNNVMYTGKKTLTPDLITIYKIKEEYCFCILDAKYYSINLDENQLTNYPGVEDITKQYLYQLAFQEFISMNGYKYIQNAFLFPYEGEEIKVLGQAEMSMFYNWGIDKLQNISVVKLPVKKMYDLYLSNRKLENLEEELSKIPRGLINKSYSSKVAKYISKIDICDSKITHTYPDILQKEVGAKIIYDVIYGDLLNYFNKLECYDDINNELSCLALEFEVRVKNIDQIEKVDETLIKEIINEVIDDKIKLKDLLENSFIKSKIIRDLDKLVKNLYL